MRSNTQSPEVYKVSSGLGLCDVLTIIFIVLKLIKVINWSWWLVLLPFWGPLAVVLASIILMLVSMAIISLFE